MCCLANTSEGAAHSNKSLICVPMDSPGVTISRTIDKIGMWSSDTAQVGRKIEDQMIGLDIVRSNFLDQFVAWLSLNSLNIRFQIEDVSSVSSNLKIFYLTWV